MAQTWQIVVTTDDSNATIHSELSPAGTGTAGDMSAPDWLRTVSTWLAGAALGNKNLSIVYTDSTGSTTIHSGL
jgi:hypothetical protein